VRSRKGCVIARRCEGTELETLVDMAEIELIEDVAVVELAYDELDANNAAQLKQDMTAIVERHSKLVFDLARLRFVDSSGLGAFLSCLRKVNERGGDLKLCAMSKTVRAVFELVRMHRVFDIQPTREAAVRAFHAPINTADARAAS
jgi:anti-sigma B factor antagonist